ncbi:MAG: ATP-binding protein, partial [Enterococcus sp.]|nr:ATP-binding protein [Enterococcus sp.]
MKKQLILRRKYLNEILEFRDTELIKVVTGVRRCGKSSLLELIKIKLNDEGVPASAILSLNLESKKIPIETEDQLYLYFKDHIDQKRKAYLFIDEPQRVKGWQNAINALRIDFDCDIYLTGSNAYLLSSEISTYLSGRYVEIQMLPLSFSEYLDFCGIKFHKSSSAALDKNGNPLLFEDIFNKFLLYGGMPAIASAETTQSQH